MGKLSAGQRQHLKRSQFALPGKGEGPKGAGAGSYPIPDASHARNALARVSQHGSPEEKAKVRAAVHSKYPGIGRADGGPVTSDFRKRSDLDFGDEPRWTPDKSGKIDNYSASMNYGEDPNSKLIGINDPRPTAGAAADDMADKMISGERTVPERACGGRITERGKETLAKLQRRHGGCV